MMKKISIKIGKTLFVILSLIGILAHSYYHPVILAEAASETLGDLKNNLKDLEQKQAENNNKKKKTESEISAKTKEQNKASNDLEETKNTIEGLKTEIEKTNNEIDKKKAETEELLRQYQKLQSDNVYTAYISGATSMTEMIMRMDAIDQLTSYNQEELDELELLINTNKKLEKKLGDYEVELDQKIVAYEALIDDLKDDLAEIELGVFSTAEEIEIMQETIKSYEKLGCKDNQKLTDCLNLTNSTGWVKPVSKGRITSLYGARKSPTPGASSNHRGIDIGISEKTPVYGTAAGKVGAIARQKSCGGNMVYVWAYVNGKPYTYVYMHLYRIDVEVGQAVNINTQIGLSGGGSTAKKNGGYDTCTTGAHLHYGLAEDGFWGSDAKKYPLGKFNSHTINPPGFPSKIGDWFYSRF